MDASESLDGLFALLASMPDVLERAAAELGPGKLALPGPDGLFSMVEQAWHLADLEREGFGERIGLLLRQKEPFLPDFDGARVARERDYRSRGFDEGLAAFRSDRRHNLEALRGAPEGSWQLWGHQEKVGRVTLGDIPRKMRDHDAAHREEIQTLLTALRSP